MGIHLNKALFVKEIIPPENKIIISDNLQALEKNEMYLTHWNLINPDVVLGHEDVIVKNTLPETSQPMHCHLTGRPATAYTTA